MAQRQNSNSEVAPAWAKKLEELKHQEIELARRDFEVRQTFQRTIEELRDDFAKTCGLTFDIDDLKLLMIGIDKKLDAILAWIVAEQSGDKRELKRKLEELRKKTNGLTFAQAEKNPPPPPMSTAQIRRELTERVDEEELRTLCFDLDIEYDNLRGEGKAAKVRELVALMEREGRVGRLRQWLETQKAPGD